MATTETELNAIAAQLTQGASKPVAAIGIPINIVDFKLVSFQLRVICRDLGESLLGLRAGSWEKGGGLS